MLNLLVASQTIDGQSEASKVFLYKKQGSILFWIFVGFGSCGV